MSLSSVSVAGNALRLRRAPERPAGFARGLRRRSTLLRSTSESARLSQARQRDLHEPLHGALRRQAPSRRECVEAVPRELVWWDVLPDVPVRGGLAQQSTQKPLEVLLGASHVASSVEEGGHVVVVMPVLYESERLDDSLEPLYGRTALVPERGELLEVSGDLALMPGEKDRFDVGEVLVQRGPTNAGLLGDLRHRNPA